jgi:hypothetical protein
MWLLLLLVFVIWIVTHQVALLATFIASTFLVVLFLFFVGRGFAYDYTCVYTVLIVGVKLGPWQSRTSLSLSLASLVAIAPVVAA